MEATESITAQRFRRGGLTLLTHTYNIIYPPSYQQCKTIFALIVIVLKKRITPVHTGWTADAFKLVQYTV